MTRKDVFGSSPWPWFVLWLVGFAGWGLIALGVVRW